MVMPMLARSIASSAAPAARSMQVQTVALPSVRAASPCLHSTRGASRVTALQRSLHSSCAAKLKASTSNFFAGAVKSEPFIPVIPFAQFMGSADPAARAQVAKDLTNAFKSSGFAYVSDHGVDQRLIDRAFELSAQFFELDQDIKDRLAWRSPRANRGYVATGRERVTNVTDDSEIAKLRQAAPDVKESLEIGREVDPEFTNFWPTEAELPEFRATMLKLREALDALHLEVLRAIAIGLDLNSAFFDEKCNQEWHTLRLLHYPPTPVSKAEIVDTDTRDTNRAGAHTDYGSLTLLIQGGPGLQVRDPKTGNWVNAPPIDGTIVINVGDLLSRWSNNVLVSTVHRVTAPPLGDPAATHTPRRYSIPFFTNPNPATCVEVLPTCVAPGEMPKYGPVITEKYLEQRLAQTYT